MWHKTFYVVSLLVILVLTGNSLVWPSGWYLFILVIPLVLKGIADTFSKNNVVYNYPMIGHIRYLMEFISPEIRQHSKAIKVDHG